MQGVVESMRAVTAEDVAARLASKSLSARQLLDFYGKYESSGQIGPETKTWQIVRDIVIPETSEKMCCYMDIMPGGPQPPGKLVSHWWGSNFRDLVLCILQDATGLSGVELEDAFAERHFKEELLESNYWLCLFAVNQHISICGACIDCSSTDYAQNPCSCGKKKLNPCRCGSQKYPSGHVLCEVDKFDDVMSQMSAIVVALDPDLITVSRVWCVAEIGEAIIRQQPLHFVGRLADKFMDGLKTLKSVAECEASVASDKDRILQKIRDTIGIEEFDKAVSRHVLGGVEELALRQAASCGMLGHADLLLKGGARVDAADSFGRTPLMSAAEHGHKSVVKALLKMKADVDAANSRGETVVMLAAEGGQDAAVRQLLDCKADLHASDEAGFTAVMMAAKGGSLEVVAAMVRAGADVNASTNDGETAIFLAEESGNQAVVKALLDAEADPNALHAGITPLMRAVIKDDWEAAGLLLEARADPNIANEQGETALMMAAGGSNPDLVKKLLAAKANLKASAFGRTALTVAEEGDNEEIIEILTAAEVATWSRIERRAYIVTKSFTRSGTQSCPAHRLSVDSRLSTESLGVGAGLR